MPYPKVNPCTIYRGFPNVRRFTYLNEATLLTICTSGDVIKASHFKHKLELQLQESTVYVIFNTEAEVCSWLYNHKKFTREFFPDLLAAKS